MRGNVVAKPVLDRPCQLLYARLVRAFPGHIILSQVALSRLLMVDGVDAAGGPGAAAGPGISNRFSQLVVDFVVCRADFSAVAVVELERCDGRSRGRGAEFERQRRKCQYLRAAGVKVVGVAVNDLPSEAALKALVAALPLHAAAAVGA